MFHNLTDRAESEKELLRNIFEHGKEIFCHILERYDPIDLWELFEDFGRDINGGCFTTQGKEDYL